MLCFRRTKCYLLSSYVNFLNVLCHVLCALLRRRSPTSVRKVWGSDLVLEADYRLRADVLWFLSVALRMFFVYSLSQIRLQFLRK